MILTWEEYCVFENIDPLIDNENQAQIELFILAAQRTIENTCSRFFELEERELLTSASRSFVLSAYPITGLQLFIDPTAVFGPGSEITSGAYTDKESGIVTLWNYCYEPYTPAKIVWTGGFDPIPADLKLAAYKAVKWNSQRILTKNYGVRSVQSGEAITSFETTIPADVRQTLDFYKRGI